MSRKGMKHYGDMSGAVIFRALNNHVDACGKPPVINASEPGHYRGFFQNENGEQWLFDYDMKTDKAVLFGGDLGWEKPHKVHISEDEEDGALHVTIGGGMILGEQEHTWLEACAGVVQFGIRDSKRDEAKSKPPTRENVDHAMRLFMSLDLEENADWVRAEVDEHFERVSDNTTLFNAVLSVEEDKDTMLFDWQDAFMSIFEMGNFNQDEFAKLPTWGAVVDFITALCVRGDATVPVDEDIKNQFSVSA